MLRVVLTTGGTGGHIFPALAVAEELKRRNPEAVLLFVGGDYGPESRLARAAGLDFAALPARGVVGRGIKALGAGIWIGKSLWAAQKLLADFRPQVVAGFGGYAAFCPMVAAKLRGVPLLLHEQNSVPGLVNRVIARLANRVCVSFPDMPMGGQAIVTGNPVRESIRSLRDGAATISDTPRNVLIFGGSQGAAAINRAVVADLSNLRECGVNLWHQTGERDLESTRAAYAAAGLGSARVDAFITDMAAAYAWADLVVCRAGATSISELTVAGKPSVLIPFPYATHNHQTVNAETLANAGAAVLVREGELAGRPLWGVLMPLLAPRTLAAMRRASLALGWPDAAQRVAEEIESLAGAALETAGRSRALEAVL